MSAARFHAVLAALAAALALFLLLPHPSQAAETWQAEREFWIDPSQVPGFASGGASFRYLLLDPAGEPVERPYEPSLRTSEIQFEVPPVPGAYKLEAWLLDEMKNELKRGEAFLRFDNAPPPPPGAGSPAGWLRGEEVARLTVEAPPALPLSGLSGYAISVDRGGGAHPCAGLQTCAVPEIDLAAGAAGEPYELGFLPQGTTYVRVAAVSGTGIASPVRTAVFRVDATPPQLSFAGIPAGWSSGPVAVRAHAADSLSGMAPAGLTGPVTAIAVDDGSAVESLGPTAAAWVSGSGVHALEAIARDAAGNAGRSGATVRIDEDPPRVAFAPRQDPSDPERIEATVADPLSGPSAAAGSISVRLAGTRAAFEELPTRVSAGRLVAHWDSDSYPPGKYEFLARGFDAAGNAAIGAARERGGQMVLVNPLKTQVALETKLSRGQLSGRLRRLGGGVVTGKRLTVIETFSPGAEPRQRTTTLATGGDGAFSLRLRPGPSRDVVARFAGTPTLTRSSAASAHLGVATGIRLRASASTARVGGGPVVFSGSVRAQGAREAVRGLPVELQFRYPGTGWRGFRTVEADRRGRFRYAYRFSDDDSRGVRFRFRAHVKGREDWPYEPGSSRPVTVTGR